MKTKIARISGDTALEYDERGELAGMRRLPKSQPPPDLNTLKALDLVEFNRIAEQAFYALLVEMCQPAVPLRVARAEAAYRLGISSETAKRYIEKYCYAPSAPFEIVDGQIRQKGKQNG